MLARAVNKMQTSSSFSLLRPPMGDSVVRCFCNTCMVSCAFRCVIAELK